MKKHFEDKVRALIESHNRKLPDEQKIRELKAIVRSRIGFNGNEQIIVDYWTK